MSTAANLPTSDIEALFREQLAGLKPIRLAVIDDSALHAGHAGARNGGGHYRLLIVAEAFAGQTTVKRHRMVFGALGELMRSKIHALSIQAMTPDEDRANYP